MMDLSNLNDKQREAVTYTDGPLLILAGAGSGKTATMTHRIAYLIEEKNVSPYNILAVTFTNKAADEMRERVRNMCPNIHGMWILTFHAMCLRILRTHADQVGYRNNFVIYDTSDQKAVIKEIIKEKNLDLGDLKAPYILAVIGDKKEKGITPEAFAAGAQDDRTKLLAYMYRAYQKKLHENNAMDFDDLLLNTYKLFSKEKEILESYRDRFQYIMVDEYQDTNRIQYNLIYALSKKHKRLCVVGDDDQCIYEWRGADIRNILDFEEDFPGAKVIKLEQNYRSVGNILSLAHSVIANNKGRKKKKLWTDKEAGEKISYYRAEDEREEARYIAGQVETLKAGNPELAYSDFAVLYRTNAQSRQFEQTFTAENIPYRVLSGLRYYDRKEVKDMMAYMRLVINPADDLSLVRIINEPKRGVGAKTLSKLQALSAARESSLFETLQDDEVLASFPDKTYRGLRSMTDAIKLCKEDEENLSVSDIYDYLLRETGYLEALEVTGTVESSARIENLMEFKSAILDYEEKADPPKLSEFMETISLMSDVDNHDEKENAVVLMTMHSAKGLEFPVVFMPGLEDGLFPGHRSFDSPEGMEEERRLCYVGMTRAKERLFLTSAAMRTLYGKREYTRESTFLREMDSSLISGDEIYVRRPGEFGKDSSIKGPGVYTGSKDGFSDSGLAGYIPFDALRNAREARKNHLPPENFNIGDRVMHKKFGEGLVVEVKGDTIKVMFDSAGLKHMALGIAPLKKL
jgi:DNA helicase-2/ATP-dependent DNA helicase PcrA